VCSCEACVVPGVVRGSGCQNCGWRDVSNAGTLQETLCGLVKCVVCASFSTFSFLIFLFLSQTLGNQYTVDGRFRGTLNVTTINCDTTANTCIVPVNAQGFALVFFDTIAEPLSIGQATATFATTAHTKLHNTATFDPVAISRRMDIRG